MMMMMMIVMMMLMMLMMLMMMMTVMMVGIMVLITMLKLMRGTFDTRDVHKFLLASRYEGIPEYFRKVKLRWSFKTCLVET